MRRSLVVANWKMHGSLKDNDKWTQEFLLNKSINLKEPGELGELADLVNTDIVICPSYIYLSQLLTFINNIKNINNFNIFLGTQDISVYSNGAYTGQVSISMITDFCVKYVILGHSERRALCYETDELVAMKAKVVLSAGLSPIVCLGETLEQRQSNTTHQIITKQLRSVLDKLKKEKLDHLFSNLIIAYEPVWAIGTGLNATAEQAQEVHGLIRDQLSKELSTLSAANIRIIYGGSVKPNNAHELFSQPDIDGGLIGGASLDARSFLEICKAVKLK